jgi:pimeloyl-ACP methyl ester carboxylesterase
VLRFDWYGSGDSAGDVLEGGHPDSWLEDLEWAVEELKATAHVSSVALVGLRLGASVAALAARDRSDVDRLVLWDPVVDGEEYLRELSNPKNVLHPAAWRDLAKSGEEPTCSVLGFPLTPTMRTGIRKIRPEVFDPPLPPTCLVSTVDDPERYTALRRRLRDGGADFADKVMDGPVTWVEEGDFGTSGMPVPALHAIAEWLK